MCKPNYLRGVLVCFMLIIVFESGNLPSRLIAQIEHTYQQLNLAQGSHLQSIPAGDWIVCKLKNVGEYESGYAGGVLMGTMDQSIIIQDYKTEESFPVPLNAITMIYHGEAKRKLFYTWKWVKRGIFAGLGWGAMWTTFAIVQANRYDEWNYVPIIAMFATGCGEAVGITLGTLTGFIQGLVKEGKAVQYSLEGENSWQIVL